MGGIETDEFGNVTRVNAFQQWIFLDYSDQVQEENPDIFDLIMDWEGCCIIHFS